MRADAYRQYLKPVMGRSNLSVLTNAKTMGVAFESGRGTPVARGVHFTVSGPDGTRHSGKARCNCCYLLTGSLWHDLGECCILPKLSVRQSVSAKAAIGYHFALSHCFA